MMFREGKKRRPPRQGRPFAFVKVLRFVDWLPDFAGLL